VVWKVAQGEGQHHNYQHAYDATACPQNVLRRFRHQWRPSKGPRLAVEDGGTTASTATANSVNCHVTVWKWSFLKLDPQWRACISEIIKKHVTLPKWSASQQCPLPCAQRTCSAQNAASLQLVHWITQYTL
jgi:hypothetical protein